MNYPVELTQTYEIYEQIGAGGGGTVYRAVHKRLQKTVVIKKLKGAATSIQDCRTEVDILKNLRHSYLPQVIDFIECSEGIFTVMDFIPGQSLQNMLDARYAFSEKEVLKYTRQLCEALDYLHSQNPPIIHGDIKPDNIMITPEGNVCLIDFNISGMLEGKGATTFGYTRGYSAPEQAEAFDRIRQQLQTSNFENATMQRNDSDETMLLDDDATMLLVDDGEVTALLGPNNVAPEIEVKQKQSDVMKKNNISGISIDKRSDVYSLGATIYSLLTGRIRDPRDKKLALNNVSSGFSVVLAKALAYNPDKRYQDAGKMLQAVVSVHKNDKKYKNLLRRQEVTIILLFLMIAASVYCVSEGSRRMDVEKEDRYEIVTEELLGAVQQGVSEVDFEELYTEAVSLFPSNPEAYYAKAYYLYNIHGAESAAGFIDEVLSISLTENKEILSNLYYLYGECYFQMERYLQAEFCYAKAIEFSGANAELYRDYAITLVYVGKPAEAEAMLEKAVSIGLGEADIYMIRGEVARMSDNYEEALNNFAAVLSESADEYMKQRAYIMASKTYESIGTAEAYRRDTEWLEKAVTELEISSRLLIYERLVQDYIKLGEIEKDNSYYGEAIRVLKAITDMNWDTYLTYSNAVILCQRMGDLDEATLWAGQMLQKYPEHYVTYIRLCYLEIEKQNVKENSERSYKTFVEYYDKAKSNYDKMVSGNVTNAEMLQLEQAYKQIESGGWLN